MAAAADSAYGAKSTTNVDSNFGNSTSSTFAQSSSASTTSIQRTITVPLLIKLQ
jgi:hypothetical protein